LLDLALSELLEINAPLIADHFDSLSLQTFQVLDMSQSHLLSYLLFDRGAPKFFRGLWLRSLFLLGFGWFFGKTRASCSLPSRFYLFRSELALG